MSSVEEELLKRIENLERDLDDLKDYGATALAMRSVEIAIAKLQPTKDDMVIFWLPEDMNITQRDADGISQQFNRVIDGRFQFLVLVRGTVDIDLVKGMPKSPVLLPS